MSEKLSLRAARPGEMEGRIALYKDLRGYSKGFSDDGLPGAERTLLNVLGFQGDINDKSVRSPVGDQAAKDAAIKISEGFNLGYVRCKPGHGPMMHNHDTNETFVPITGQWEMSWDEDEVKTVVVGPLDCVSFPPGLSRAFRNVTEGDPNEEHILMVIVAGNTPVAGLTEKAKAKEARMRAELAQG